MGFYSQVIFPRLCDLVLSRPFVAEHRRQVLANAQGDVLEIGFGTGLNLPHYPEGVRQVTAVDPSMGMHRLALQRIRQTKIEVQQHVAKSEQLPFEEHTFDSVVSTFTLCSVQNAEQAVAEVLRVLKPGGRFLFLEHGLSPEPGVQKWQRRLNWLEMRLAGGCRLDQNVRQLVAAHPFASIAVEEFYLQRVPRTHGYLYRGAALR